MNINFSLTNDSVMVYLPSGPKSFFKGSTQYAALAKALFDESSTNQEIEALCETHGALTKQLYGTDFLVSTKGDVTYKGHPLPQSIVDRMNQLVIDGQSVAPIARFFERLDKNPSNNARENVFAFIQHNDIQIEPGGTLLAYKGVEHNGFDRYTGTIDNTPGQGEDGRTIIRMPRNLINENRRATCQAGLHVGAKGYAAGNSFSTGGFAPRHLVVRVDPEHIVCVPEDYNGMKMRVCEYEVVGEYTGDQLDPRSAKDVEFSRTWGNNNCEPEFVHMDDSDEDPDEFDPNEYDSDDDGLNEEEEVPNIFDQPGEPSSVQPLVEVEPTFIIQKKVKHRFDRLRRATELMEKSIEDLRKYAGKSLKIVGASKLGGGKATLVSKIMDIRAKLGR